MPDNEFNFEKLRTLVSAEVFDSLQGTCAKYEINTSVRIAHFLSQAGHESNSFKAARENLNYGAEGLLKVFHKYFPDEATAATYARQPEKIANRVYANRLGNGDEASGDGWKYRGGGYIQVTGRSNYGVLAADLEDDRFLDTPEIIAEPENAMLSAGWFWDRNNLNEIADGGADDETIKAVTRKVNGGYNGLDDRTARFNRIYDAIKEVNV